ncbi:MAG: MauE/DoxX family redox-associated membrane protein [Bryobacteraceae bacterium]
MTMARYLRLILRIALGAVFAYAAWLKLKEDWYLFAMAIDGYKLLPQWAVILVARTLPTVELLLGLLLIAGPWLRYSSAALTLILGVFFGLMVRSYVLGMHNDCGCFGGGDPISPHTLLRDGTLLAGALALTALAWLAPCARRSNTTSAASPAPDPDSAPAQ